MSYEVLARKHRPKTFEEMVGQKAVAQTLQNAVRTDKVSQAYLFSGQRGTGKTTAARILAKALNCVNGPTPTPCNKCEFCLAIADDRAIDVLEIDGASNRKVEDVEPIRETVKYKPVYARYKVLIIDEVHMLSTHAFNALLKTLEEPPPNTVFIFATTELAKVPATIVSRCQHFEFRKLARKEIIDHLARIAQAENFTVSPAGLEFLAASADGSLRDALSLLDQAVAFSGEAVRDEDLQEMLGLIGLDVFLAFSDTILDEHPERVFALVEDLLDKGRDLRSFFKGLIEHFRELLLVSSVPDTQGLLAVTAEELAALKARAAKATAEDFLRYLLALQQAEAGFRYSSHQRIFLEALLVKLCHFRKLVPLKELVEDLEAIRSSAESRRPAPSPPPAPARTAPPGRPEGTGPRASSITGGRSAATAAGGSVSSRTETPPASAKPAAQAAPGEQGPRELFGRVLERLQRDKAALAAIVAQYSSLKYHDGAFELFFEAGKTFYIATIQRDLKAVEKAAAEVLGRPTTIRLAEDIVPEVRPRGKETDAALKDPVVQSFMNAFKAQIVSVEPVARRKEGGS
ncbi:MAG: DNA polymerase III subunit gamma/tau [Candidatus Aminicenantes bacterium]|nr:DNA polymerase III subunit gamma/tau [Candidatus Aminicenantes bacterium]